MAGFEVRSSRHVADAGFLRVSEAALATPDGDEVTRYVVHHPGAVVVVPVVDGRRALLVRQYRVPVGGALLELPAGKRDVEREPPEETARRELEEEVAHRAGHMVKLAHFYNSPGFCDELTHVYLASELEAFDAGFEGKAEERHMSIETVDLDDVGGLVAAGEIVDAKSIIGLMLARAYLAGAYPGVE